LIADSDIEAGKRTAAAVASWGLQPILVHDGVEAMLTIQRMLPSAVVLDAALPKMFGFQICEVVKRNESLRATHVVLIGAVHHRDRYRRPPSELYGADVYIERPELPDGLVPVLRRFGLPVQAVVEPRPPAPPKVVRERVEPEPPAPPVAQPTAPVEQPVRPPAQPTPPVTPAAPPVESPAPVASPTPAMAQRESPPVAQPAPAAVQPTRPVQPPAAAPAVDGLEEERAKAERLARIIVSDIVLYNADEFAAAVRDGNVLEALAPALEEGRELFRQRIDERVRSGHSYLEDELLRIAAERGGG
jgi:CheY-like chemotaxis protein